MLAGAEPIFLVGSSWGAMLRLAYAAAHPGDVPGVVLIGCGTFDAVARAQFRATLENRIDASLSARLDQLNQVSDADERLCMKNELLTPIYSCDLISMDLEYDDDAAGAVKRRGRT